jgi:hypothetical protein
MRAPPNIVFLTPGAGGWHSLDAAEPFHNIPVMHDQFVALVDFPHPPN